MYFIRFTTLIIAAQCLWNSGTNVKSFSDCKINMVSSRFSFIVSRVYSRETVKVSIIRAGP